MHLEESLHSAEIVLPPEGPTEVVHFGTTVTVREGDGSQATYRIVRFKFPSGEKTLEIVDIRYE
jgi:transcription elongation GreA/GreB family factor